MSYPVIVDSYMIDSLKRKARAARLQACRASPTLEMQLKSLADRYEADVQRMTRFAMQTGPASDPDTNPETALPLLPFSTHRHC